MHDQKLKPNTWLSSMSLSVDWKHNKLDCTGFCLKCFTAQSMYFSSICKTGIGVRRSSAEIMSHLQFLENCKYLPIIGYGLVFLLGYFVYYRLVVVRPCVLHSKVNSNFTRLLNDNLSVLNESYWPLFWCYESRLQTALGTLLRSAIKDVKYNREVRNKV